MKKLIILLTLNVLFAQVPHKMSFQAYLTDANNMPVAPGSYEMTFRIYDSLTKGFRLWEESQTVTVDGSLVSVMLGNTVPLIALSSAGYLEIQLKDEVLSPRQELGGTMFAIKAVNADKAMMADKAMIADTAKVAVGYAKLDTLAVYAKTGDIIANTDDQTLLLSGDTLYISDGNNVVLSSYKDTFTDTDDQTLSISGDTLYISEGNNTVLSPYKDNTDTQDLSFNSSTKVLSLTDGGTVDLSGFSATSGASSLDGLTDVLVETNSFYIGNDPSSTTSTAERNVAVGVSALDAISTGDNNVAVGYDALTANTYGSNNTAFGTSALASTTTADNNTASGASALYSNGRGEANTASGASALYSNTYGDYNTASGASALYYNTTGNYNTASGYQALRSNTEGDDNTASGTNALYSNTTGDYNTASGASALTKNTTGGSNTAAGHEALYSNTEGDDNTASGYYALYSNTTGDDNTASGTNALYYNTTGGNNTALGPYALHSNTTASFNTAVGYMALQDANRTADVNAYNTAIGYKAGNTGTMDITTGNKNVLIGSSTRASTFVATNQIVIGHGAFGRGDNEAVIGNTDITSLYAASDGAAVLYANGTIQSSDRRVKKSINTLAYGLNFIMKLRPVSYYKLHPRNYPQELKDKFYPDGKIRQVGAEDYDKLQVGFIAQEVKAVNDEMHAENNIVSIDEDGFHRLDYEKIIVPLVKAVQEQQAQIAEFVKGAKAQETQITELQNKINAIMEMQASASASKSYGEGDE